MTLALTCAFVGCRDDKRKSATTNVSAQADDGTVTMQIGKETFHLEIAVTTAEHEHGLMARDTMAADHGMIFVFAGEDERNFWMKDTLIPLDIIYMDASGRVISVKSMKPRDLTGVSSNGRAKYAIELLHGAAERTGVQPGNVLTIPKEISSKQGEN
jgi:uncharacterized membrane protein (UPF0127 family)